MKLIHVSRSYEVAEGPETATAESVRIGTRNYALDIRWKSAEDGRTSCLYIDMCWAGKWFELINRKPKETER